jgi:hypothetical protein
MISKEYLIKEYSTNGYSASEIAKALRCSSSKVTYWLHKHNIHKRSISEAIYTKSNPNGDPFEIACLHSDEDWFLLGLGLGLYWGEGTKSNKHSVRLGNTDPKLILMFLKFLNEIYRVDKSKLHFGLQIFSDMDPKAALAFWIQELQVSRKQFQKVIVTPSRGEGTYRKKTQHGVLTIYFNNKKLRDIIVRAIKKLQDEAMPS